MARYFAALLVAFCACALIADAYGQDDLQFSLFDPVPVAAAEPLEFSLFDAPPIEHTTLKFSLFDSPAEAGEIDAAPNRQVIYFTAEWCSHCKANKPTLAKLKDAKWRVGPADDAQIRVVDLDEQKDLARQYRVNGIPCWVATAKGKEVARRHGYLDPFAVGRLYHGSDKTVAAR